jgi:RNA polymerase sigma-32 factor
MAKNLFSLALDHPSALSRERETELAQRWRDARDVVARDLLVRAHLRSVVATARRYQNRGATSEELVAEGNFGLVQALAKFDPQRGIRFVTYAAYWIRACIVGYLTRSRSVDIRGGGKVVGRGKQQASQ